MSTAHPPTARPDPTPTAHDRAAVGALVDSPVSSSPAWPFGVPDGPARANGAPLGADAPAEAPSTGLAPSRRPQVPPIGLRLTATGSPSFEAWASCLTLGDLEAALGRAVA